MTNAQRIRALAIAREENIGHTPLRWEWPINNCFDTGLPWPPREPKHPNAAKCNFTPTGPSRRTLTRRAARGKRTKPAYL